VIGVVVGRVGESKARLPTSRPVEGPRKNGRKHGRRDIHNTHPQKDSGFAWLERRAVAYLGCRCGRDRGEAWCCRSACVMCSEEGSAERTGETEAEGSWSNASGWHREASRKQGPAASPAPQSSAREAIRSCSCRARRERAKLRFWSEALRRPRRSHGQPHLARPRKNHLSEQPSLPIDAATPPSSAPPETSARSCRRPLLARRAFSRPPESPVVRLPILLETVERRTPSPAPVPGSWSDHVARSPPCLAATRASPAAR